MRREGALLLADISGYTSFLQGVADAHRAVIVDAAEPPPAYAILSELLDTIAAAVAPAFRLAKFEGDAVFAVGDEPTVSGAEILASVRSCHAAFGQRLGSARSQWTCSCDACSLIGDLDLKFVLHHGAYVAQSIAGHEELLGPDVNLVHRLLKNHVRELVGPVPYVLLTEAALAALAIPRDGMVATEESYDGQPPTRAAVLVLGP